MNCQEAGCKHYIHMPADGAWCAVNGELYRRIITGDLPQSSRVTLAGFTDGTVCGDYEAQE